MRLESKFEFKMSVNESQLKQSVQQAIKNVLIDSKYNDEAISFG